MLSLPVKIYTSGFLCDVIIVLKIMYKRFALDIDKTSVFKQLNRSLFSPHCTKTGLILSQRYTHTVYRNGPSGWLIFFSKELEPRISCIRNIPPSGLTILAIFSSCIRMRKDFTSSKRVAQFHAVACPTSESAGNVIILRPPVTSPTIIAIILCILELSILCHITTSCHDDSNLRY